MTKKQAFKSILFCLLFVCMLIPLTYMMRTSGKAERAVSRITTISISYLRVRDRRRICILRSMSARLEKRSK